MTCEEYLIEGDRLNECGFNRLGGDCCEICRADEIGEKLRVVPPKHSRQPYLVVKENAVRA